MTTPKDDLFSAAPTEGRTMEATEGMPNKAPVLTEGQIVDSVATLAEVKEILEQYLFPIFAGMVSSEIFSASPNHGAIKSYLRLKELLGISHGCSSDQVKAVQTYKHDHPREYARIVRELEFQVAVLSLRGRRGRIFDNLFQASALLLNASPMSNGDADPTRIREFEEAIHRGQLNVE